MKQEKHKLTLDRPALYQIKVPGHLDERWLEWNGKMTAAVDFDGDDFPITVLTGAVDQAALQGLLRRLYAQGLPLISVVWVGSGLKPEFHNLNCLDRELDNAAFSNRSILKQKPIKSAE